MDTMTPWLILAPMGPMVAIMLWFMWSKTCKPNTEQAAICRAGQQKLQPVTFFSLPRHIRTRILAMALQETNGGRPSRGSRVLMRPDFDTEERWLLAFEASDNLALLCASPLLTKELGLLPEPILVDDRPLTDKFAGPPEFVVRINKDELKAQGDLSLGSWASLMKSAMRSSAGTRLCGLMAAWQKADLKGGPSLFSHIGSIQIRESFPLVFSTPIFPHLFSSERRSVLYAELYHAFICLTRPHLRVEYTIRVSPLSVPYFRLLKPFTVTLMDAFAEGARDTNLKLFIEGIEDWTLESLGDAFFDEHGIGLDNDAFRITQYMAAFNDATIFPDEGCSPLGSDDLFRRWKAAITFDVEVMVSTSDHRKVLRICNENPRVYGIHRFPLVSRAQMEEKLKTEKPNLRKLGIRRKWELMKFGLADRKDLVDNEG